MWLLLTTPGSEDKVTLYPIEDGSAKDKVVVTPAVRMNPRGVSVPGIRSCKQACPAASSRCLTSQV